MSNTSGFEDTLPPSATGAVLPGAMIGGYRVVRRLGEGAMGAVYAAVQPDIEKKVAIKVLKPEMLAVPQMAERFLAEARAVNRIGHPNIVDIFAFGHLPDQTPYFVMEFLEGETLADRLASGPIPRADLIIWLRQLCDALAAAHRAGIVHRDLKPANIWLVAEGPGQTRLKLLDFGIAKEMDANTKLTGAGFVMGTPDYMAPEQGLGQPIDARADVYALGVILYEIASGTVPFKGNSNAVVMFKHAGERPTAPSLHRPVPRALEEIILACMEKNPADRPATIEAVWQRLEGAFASLPDTVGAAGAPRGPATQPPSWQTGAGAPPDAPVPSPSRITVEPVADLPAPARSPGRSRIALVAVAVVLSAAGVAFYVVPRAAGEHPTTGAPPGPTSASTAPSSQPQRAALPPAPAAVGGFGGEATTEGVGGSPALAPVGAGGDAANVTPKPVRNKRPAARQYEPSPDL